MRSSVHRFALAVALCAVYILLIPGVASSTGVGRTPALGGAASSGAWVQAFTWFGGGSGNDIRNSAPFTLQGGHQAFRASAVAVSGEYANPECSWTIESVDGSGGFELVAPPGMGQISSDLYLPAGSYFVGSNTLDCTWTLDISELRDTRVPVFIRVSLSGVKFGNASHPSLKLGKAVTVKGGVQGLGVDLSGGTVRLMVERELGTAWVGVKRTSLILNPAADFSWKYTPAKKGAYRVQATIAETDEHLGDESEWQAFTVR